MIESIVIVRAVIESIVIERALRALSAHYARYCAIIAQYQIAQIAPDRIKTKLVF